MFPDGYLPKVPGDVTDKSKATSAWNKSVKDKEARREEFRAAKANMASKADEGDNCSEEDDFEASNEGKRKMPPAALLVAQITIPCMGARSQRQTSRQLSPRQGCQRARWRSAIFCQT